MRIEKLELIGFKSFGDKTVFNFHPGITCIVGPNGCGKSNVVDAFRWVLGEQSAKSLRGEKMEEVIFNGSTSKKPKGMAEVSLYISGINPSREPEQNGDNGEPESDIVTVTRRLYRSGDSEYILNKTPCRLKDIKDLFLDTGLEVKSFSILEQDRITEILNAKPQERRILIEEVAGVMKYNVRKKEALSKLESSRANLQRVNDIVAEVKKQINFLDRLAKKAERFKKLSSEINLIELKIAKRDYDILGQSYAGISSEYNMLKEQDAVKRTELSTIENETEKRRLELAEKEKALDEIQIKFQGLEREIAEIEKAIAVAKTEIENQKEYLSRLLQQKEEYADREADNLAKKQELEKTSETLISELENQREILREKSDIAKNLEDELAEKEELLEDRRKDVFKISEELSNLKNSYNKIISSIENLKHREENAGREAESLKRTLSDVDISIKDIQSSLLDKNNNLIILNDQKTNLLNELSENKNKFENLRESLSKLKEELASSISRAESLKELVLDSSTKELFSGDVKFQLIASLSDTFQVDSKYEKAVEGFLSEKVNSFILQTFDDINSAVSLIKAKGLARTGFIPANNTSLDDIKESPNGVIGKAIDFIKAGNQFSSIIKRIFHNVFIVQDLNSAFELIKAGHNLHYVTLEGDVIEPSGTVIAGEIKGVLKRKRELRELESEIEDKKLSIERIQKNILSLQQMIESKEAELKSIESSIVEREKEISLLKLTAENFKEDKERRSRKLAYVALEIEQITKEKEALNKLLFEKEQEIKVVDDKRSILEQNCGTIQEEISQKKSQLEEQRSEVTDIRLTLTSLKEKIDSISKEKESISKELGDIQQKKEFLAEEISSVQSRIIEKENEMLENEDKIKLKVSEADKFRFDISTRKDVIDNENQHLFSIEQYLKQLRSQTESLSQRLNELDVQRAEHKIKMENLAEHVRQNYGHNIEDVEVEPLTEDDEVRLAELKQKVQELGTVNLGTIEEYEELRTRYEFLTNQQNDLNKSIAELEEAISKINITTRKKLREAYEALKAKFSEVFVSLFGGGRAEIILTDENNILETGIDIIAQPPGKRLQNISLLSGGEKTLTALSLLFASFLLKPTPLCILDEADSALDEINTDKFASLLKEFSRDTQFIVVTHNRNTMSVADYIYGITMEEAGVSKVISMQLVEAQALT